MTSLCQSDPVSTGRFSRAHAHARVGSLRFALFAVLEMGAGKAQLPVEGDR
jgi:hypothetical protein